METPAIVLNVKAYEESFAEGGLSLARACQEAAEETGFYFAICPQMVDLAWIARQVDVPCFAQHTDNVGLGSQTGWTTPEAVKASGAVGTLLNHSEHRIRIADIDGIISKAKGLGLESLVATNNIRVSRAVAALEPTSLAVEPPELIGTGISVSQADPDVVSGTVDTVREINKKVIVLCGAGISTGDDVKSAIELGAQGVLLASGVVKAPDPKAVLLDLVSKI